MNLEKMIEAQKKIDERKKSNQTNNVSFQFSEQIQEKEIKDIQIDKSENAVVERISDNSISNEYQIIKLKIDKITPYTQHPFRLYDGERLADMVESIKQNGVLQPVIVRKIKEDTYEMLSGHNRMNAAKKAGLEELPAICKSNVSDEDALMYVVESNLLQRSFSEMSISEQAAVISLRYSEMFSQGKRNDIFNELKSFNFSDNGVENLTFRPVGEKLNTHEIISDEYKLSTRNISRLIRINKLNDFLKAWVDEKKLSVRAGVELSFLKEDEQDLLSEILSEDNYKIDLNKAIRLRKETNLTAKKIQEILLSQKPIKKLTNKISISRNIISQYFPKGSNPKEIEETIKKALKLYFNNQDNKEEI